MENQTIGKIPIIVINDGSGNNDTEKALDIINTHGNIRIEYLPYNQGTSAALNKGHELIQTEWIAIMGSDDISHRERLERQFKHLKDHPEVDVLGTNLFSFYDDDFTRKPAFISSHRYTTTLQERTEGWLTNHGTVVYRNQAVKDVGGYDITKRRAQDVDLWTRMSNAGKRIHTLPEVLYAWRRFR